MPKKLLFLPVALLSLAPMVFGAPPVGQDTPTNAMHGTGKNTPCVAPGLSFSQGASNQSANAGPCSSKHPTTLNTAVSNKNLQLVQPKPSSTPPQKKRKK